MLPNERPPWANLNPPWSRYADVRQAATVNPNQTQRRHTRDAASELLLDRIRRRERQEA